jgi:hypothetical protein
MQEKGEYEENMPEKTDVMTEQQAKVYNFFTEKGFLKADKDSYSVYKNYSQYSDLQEMSAFIVCAWSNAYRGLYKIINECLCSIYFHKAEQPYFIIHRPIGKETSLQALIDTLYDMATEAGLPNMQVKLIEERFIKEYEAVLGYDIQTSFNENENEYIYKINDLLKLTGTVNFYKRKRLKRFFNDPLFTIRPITNETITLCSQIEDVWCKHTECEGCESFTGCEKKAIDIMINIFDEAVHCGLFLYYNEDPVGFIICEKINKRVSYLYFGKANKHDGFIYLIYAMFKDYLTGVEYMNMAEDLGDPGLRIFKSKLSSHEFLQRHVCTFTRTGSRTGVKTS